MMKNVCTLLFSLIAFLGFSQNEIITVWEIPANENELQLIVGNTSPVAYTWETIPAGSSGSGTFPTSGSSINGQGRAITGLPNTGVTIRLTVNGTGLTRFLSQQSQRTWLFELEQWGTAAWLNANGMFNGCENLTITATDVPNFSNTDGTSAMFQDCDSLTSIPNMNSWDVSNVTNMISMFKNAGNFNEPIGNWDVSNVVNMLSMFERAASFNQDLNNWDVSNVTSFMRTFDGASSFNGNITNWDVSGANSLFIMFKGASSFNQDIGSWDVSNVTTLGFIFQNATSFNQNINNWDVSSNTNFRSMFANATSFNQPLNNWDLTGGANSMSGMFAGASSFNQPLDNWDVSNFTDMGGGLFAAATAFNQDISAWDVSNVTNFLNFMNNACNASFSRTNYDKLLNSWANQNLQSNINIRFQCIDYCLGDSARTYIENTFNWDFQNDNLDCSGCTTPVTSTDVQTACDSFTWLDGNTYNSSNNTATFTLVAGSANGCDSIVTLDLSITETPVLSLAQSGATLEATPGFTNYNWFNVATGAISGANSATFTPTASGDYFVEVDNNGCVGTSNTVDFTLPLVPLILVSSITVEGQGGASTITTNGGTLQMSATVLPTNADDGSFIWSVVNGTGSATIDANGLLTASADGTVEVSATANDASGESGSKTITISNQSVGINDLAFENLSIYPNPTSGKVNLDISEKLTSIQLMDLTGKTIKVFNVESKQLDISAFTQGIYFLQIANAERKSVVKIVKK